MTARLTNCLPRRRVSRKRWVLAYPQRESWLTDFRCRFRVAHAIGPPASPVCGSWVAGKPEEIRSSESSLERKCSRSCTSASSSTETGERFLSAQIGLAAWRVCSELTLAWPTLVVLCSVTEFSNSTVAARNWSICISTNEPRLAPMTIGECS